MTRLLPAEVVAAFTHLFHHVAIAYSRLQSLQARFFNPFEKANIRHHRRHNGAVVQLPLAIQRIAKNTQDEVAVDFITLLIDRDQTIRVAVKSKPDGCAMLNHLGAKLLRVGGAAIIVDVAPIRLCADGDHFRSQLAEDQRRQLIGGAMRAIKHNLHAVE
ncbi:hypothetical protein D3C85_1018080 [compost metagenome]